MHELHRLVSLGLLVLSSSILFAHPGRTDSSGGHHDRKNGGYHYHGSSVRVSSSPPVAWSLPSPISKARTSARTEARTQVRTIPRKNTIALAFQHALEDKDSKSPNTRKPIEKEKRLLESPNFILFFKGERILELVSFDRTPDGYEIVATHGGQAFYPYEMVDRIEPINQMRIWRDISGRFQIEAVYIDTWKHDARLRKKDDTVINVSLSLLSKDDRTFVEAIQSSSRNRSE